MARTTYYSEDMPGKVLEFMKNGCLPCELAGKLEVRREDVLAWLRDTRKIDFRDAFKIGMAASEAYWTRMAFEALTTSAGRSFREKLYLYIMSSQFGWEKKETEIDKIEHERVMSDEELDKKLEQLLGETGANVVSISQAVTNKKKKAA